VTPGDLSLPAPAGLEGLEGDRGVREDLLDEHLEGKTWDRAATEMTRAQRGGRRRKSAVAMPGRRASDPGRGREKGGHRRDDLRGLGERDATFRR
jgi:hypothetical protein